MYKGIIFDLDGTLLDTIDDLNEAVNIALSKFNLKTINREQTLRSVGTGFRNLLDKAASYDLNYDKTDLDDLVKEFEMAYAINFKDKTKAYDGIYELLKELSDKEYPLAINTNKRESYAKELVSLHFPDIKFDFIIGESEDFAKKPDPSAANMIIDKWKLAKHQVLYVGDSEVDLLTAINANIDAIHVSWGFRSYEDVCELEFIESVKSVDRLKAIILDKRKMAYIASHFFNAAMFNWTEELASYLESSLDLKLYVPQRNDSINDKKNNDAIITDIAISKADTKMLRKSDILIANLDGLTIDDGVAGEIMAFGIMNELEKDYGIKNNRLIIGILSDMRHSGSGANRLYRNLMIIGKIKEHGQILYTYPKDLSYREELINLIKNFDN